MEMHFGIFATKQFDARRRSQAPSNTTSEGYRLARSGVLERRRTVGWSSKFIVRVSSFNPSSLFCASHFNLALIFALTQRSGHRLRKCANNVAERNADSCALPQTKNVT